GLVLESAAIAVTFAFWKPLHFPGWTRFAVGPGGALAIPPAIQLQVVNWNPLGTIPLDQRLESAGVPLLRVVIVVVSRSVVRPIAEILEHHVRVLPWPFGPRQLNQGATPQIPRPIDPLAEGEHGLLREPGWDVPQLRVEAARQFLPAIAEHGRDHEMRRGRNHQRVRVIIKEQ